MLKFLATIVGAAVVGISLLVHFLGGDTGPAYEPVPINTAPKEPPVSWLDSKASAADRIRQEVAGRFGAAPEEIIELAAQIANPEVPLADYGLKLEALEAGEINAGYGQPYPHQFPQYRHSLLREAVLAGNAGAGAILVSKGADLTYNDNEIAYQATLQPRPTEGYTLRFQDYSAGSKFLAMWLRQGGNPDFIHPLYSDTQEPLLHRVPHDNLEGLAFLLAAGAKPWQTYEFKADNDTSLYDRPSFFEKIATTDLTDLELSFRLARLGFYQDAPQEDAKRLAARYETLARDATSFSDGDGRATAWAFDKATKEIYASINQRPGPRLTALSKSLSGTSTGGFWLSPSEIRSPDNVAQRRGDRRDWGPHRW